MNSPKDASHVKLTRILWVAMIFGLVLGFAGISVQEYFPWVTKLFLGLIKAVAGPFLFATIIGALLESPLQWKDARRLGFVLLLHTVAAAMIAVFVASVFAHWIDPVKLLALTNDATGATPTLPRGTTGIGPLHELIPKSLLTPFLNNELPTIALFAVGFGIALRMTYLELNQNQEEKLRGAIDFFAVIRDSLQRILHGILWLSPLVVLSSISHSISRGSSAWAELLALFLAPLLAMTAHAIIVYPSWVGGFSWSRRLSYLRDCAPAISHGFAINSSLATLPVSLRIARQLGFSSKNANLGLCIGTNANNDGILLYEVTVLLLLLSLGSGLGLNWPLVPEVLILALVTTWGVAGVPEAGIVALSILLDRFHLPQGLLVLLLSLDWILARMRSGVNTLADLSTAAACEVLEKRAHLMNPSPHLESPLP